MIILCTGYTRNFPFLDEDILKPKRSGKYLPLYKEMFPIKRSESLAFVGMFSTSNSIAFTSEMQARYIAEVFLGNIRLPKPDVMEQCIQAKCKIFDDMFGGDLKELNYVRSFFFYIYRMIICNHVTKSSFLELGFTLIMQV